MQKNSLTATAKSLSQEECVSLLRRLFKSILPEHGFVFRVKQLELSESILAALWQRQTALCEAGVGSGKTLAYLAASTLYRRFSPNPETIIVSTSTIALQKAITEEYLPKLSEIMLAHSIISTPLRFALRKGKTHYVCDARLKTYLFSVGALGNDLPLLAKLNALRLAPLLKIDLSLHPLSRYVKDKISVLGQCQKNCPNIGVCRYHAYIKMCMSESFDYQITNHNYVLANILSKKEKHPAILPPHQAIIFDEAHKLLEAARQMYGKQLGQDEIPQLVRKMPLSRIPSKQGRKAVDDVQKALIKTNAALFEALERKNAAYQKSESDGKPFISTSIKNQFIQLQETLALSAMLCHRQGDAQLKTSGHNIAASYAALAARLASFAKSEKDIFWLDSLDNSKSLCAVPIDLAHLLYKDLWSIGKANILTSGTLSVNGCFSLVMQNLGLSALPKSKLMESSTPSPFNYEQNAILYIPENMPFPKNESKHYVAALVREIAQILAATHGHSLILFTSYWLMERVHGLMKDEIAREYPVFVLARGRADVLENFRHSKNGVLFASDSAGEGIDLAGDILSSLIIVRLPFAVPNALTQHEQSQYGSLHVYLNAVAIPNMLIKLKQYVGRGIRTETDTAAISILDSRAAKTGRYHKPILKALPPCAVTSNIKDVETFIQSKKEKEYFK